MYQKCILRDPEVFVMCFRCTRDVCEVFRGVVMPEFDVKMSDVFLYAVPVMIYC